MGQTVTTGDLQGFGPSPFNFIGYLPASRSRPEFPSQLAHRIIPGHPSGPDWRTKIQLHCAHRRMILTREFAESSPQTTSVRSSKVAADTGLGRDWTRVRGSWGHLKSGDSLHNRLGFRSHALAGADRWVRRRAMPALERKAQTSSETPSTD